MATEYTLRDAVMPEGEEYVTCPSCGADAIARYLKSHQQTATCTGKKFVLDQVQNDRKPVYLDRQHLLKRLGIPFTIGPMPGAHDVTTKAVWVEAWVWRIVILGDTTSPGWQRSGTRNWFFAHHQASILEYLHAHPEHQPMVDGIYMLGGEDALSAALLSVLTLEI